MKLSTGLLFLAAVIVFAAVIFRSSRRQGEKLAYINEDSNAGRLKAELKSLGEFPDEEYDHMYGEFAEWVSAESLTLSEIRKKSDEDFQLDLMCRFLCERDGEYGDIKALVDRLVEERGIYRG